MDKAILRKWLKAGYMEGHVLHPTEAGTPQGGICSPVIANLALDGLEARLRTAFPRYVWGKGKRTCPKVNFIRLADDFMVAYLLAADKYHRLTRRIFRDKKA